MQRVNLGHVKKVH